MTRTITNPQKYGSFIIGCLNEVVGKRDSSPHCVEVAGLPVYCLSRSFLPRLKIEYVELTSRTPRYPGHKIQQSKLPVVLLVTTGFGMLAEAHPIFQDLFVAREPEGQTRKQDKSS